MTLIVQTISYFKKLHNLFEDSKQCITMSMPYLLRNIIFFVVVLLASQSKTLFRVLFSNLYSFSFSSFISGFQSVVIILVKSAVNTILISQNIPRLHPRNLETTAGIQF